MNTPTLGLQQSVPPPAGAGHTEASGPTVEFLQNPSMENAAGPDVAVAPAAVEPAVEPAAVGGPAQVLNPGAYYF